MWYAYEWKIEIHWVKKNLLYSQTPSVKKKDKKRALKKKEIKNNFLIIK